MPCTTLSRNQLWTETSTMCELSSFNFGCQVFYLSNKKNNKNGHLPSLTDVLNTAQVARPSIYQVNWHRWLRSGCVPMGRGHMCLDVCVSFPHLSLCCLSLAPMERSWGTMYCGISSGSLGLNCAQDREPLGPRQHCGHTIYQGGCTG